MEIFFSREAVNGQLEAAIRITDRDNGPVEQATITVWVPDSDSRKEIHAATARRTREFLSRCIAALDAEYPPPAAQ